MVEVVVEVEEEPCHQELLDIVRMTILLPFHAHKLTWWWRRWWWRTRCARC